MIFWVILNTAVAAGIINLDREDVVDVIFYLGAFLLTVITFKITFAVLSYIKSKIDRIRVYRLMRKRKSTVFDDIGKIKEMNKEEVFQVYYDYEGNYKTTTDLKDPDYLNANFKTSIHSQKTFRGFNLARLTEQHRIQQGLIGNFLGKMGTRTFYKEDGENIMDILDEDDEEEDDKKTDESASLLNSPDPAMRANISRLFMRSLVKTENKVKFEDVVETHNKILSEVHIAPEEELKEGFKEENKAKKTEPLPLSPSADLISSSSSASAEDVSPESDSSPSEDIGSDRVDSSSQIEGNFDCITSTTKNESFHLVYQRFLSDQL